MKNVNLAIMTLACALSPAASLRAARAEAPVLATPPLASAPAADGMAASDTPRVDSTPVPGSSIERVRGTVAVDAPVPRVRAVVFDFPRYQEFMPHYRRASIERKNPSGSMQVRLDMEELAGAVHVWARLEVTPEGRTGAVEGHQGQLMAGNVKAFQIRWELEELGPTRTRLTVDSFLDPDLPLVPSGLVNSGARERVRDVLLALKARAEGGG
jgi:carbon monoxide dehydrogenase subunit G